MNIYAMYLNEIELIKGVKKVTWLVMYLTSEAIAFTLKELML